MVIKKKDYIASLVFLSSIAIIFSHIAKQYISSFNVPDYTGIYFNDFYIKDYLKKTSTDINSDGNHIYDKKHGINLKQQYQHPLYNDAQYTKVISENQVTENEKNLYNIIHDHSVKLSGPCQSGTGWILDFEIPKKEENGSEYPLKWFIATNLHVVNNYYFSENKFDQILPHKIIKNLKINKPYENKSSWLWHLLKQKSQAYDEFSCNTSHEIKKSYLLIHTQYENFFNEQRRWINNHFSRGPYTKNVIHKINIENPHLFYAPINFLGKRYGKNGNSIFNKPYHKDFAVLEINFKNKSSAKTITHDFYNKYYKNAKTSAEENNSLNLFADEIMKNKTIQELKNHEGLFVGGYPNSPNINLNFEINKKTNISNSEVTKSKLTIINANTDNNNYEENLLNKHNEIILGHADLKKIDYQSNVNKLWWNNGYLLNWGYNYLIDNTFLTPGSSGSLTIDSNKNLIGLYRMHNLAHNIGFIEPIRSEGLYDNGKIILPKYDLIKGTENQVFSYKSQLEKYYPDLQTYLKTKSWN